MILERRTAIANGSAVDRGHHDRNGDEFQLEIRFHGAAAL
jgi:hypothetical protein